MVRKARKRTSTKLKGSKDGDRVFGQGSCGAGLSGGTNTATKIEREPPHSSCGGKG